MKEKIELLRQEFEKKMADALSLSDLEAEKNALEGEITRLESLVARFKAEFERISRWLEESTLNFKKTVGNLTERMQKYMESVKYTDGTSVYDSFKAKELTLAEKMEEARKESKSFGMTIEEWEAEISMGRSSADNSFGGRSKDDHTNSRDDFELE